MRFRINCLLKVLIFSMPSSIAPWERSPSGIQSDKTGKTAMLIDTAEPRAKLEQREKINDCT